MATSTATRRLAAILAADVAGYSRLMGADEEGTHERLRAHLRELVDPKIMEHRGRIVKHTGDGMLAEFASVVDAVRCAAQVQRTMADRNAKTAEDRRITFRIGVNLGDVIAEEEDIYGDGVNIAARLETLAEPGGICISRVVRDQIRDKLPYPFEDRGEQSVKNIVRSVRVYALRPEVLAELPAASVPAAAPRRRIPLAVIAMDWSGARHDRHRLVALAVDEILSDAAGGGRHGRGKCADRPMLI
jgi:adenylate cyclase